MEMVLGNRRSEAKKGYQRNQWWGPTRKGSGGGFERPPLSPGGSQSVPQWEKKFCTSVCLVPWQKLCETQKLLYMYPKVAEWNDSEGEEAFYHAKARYWAEINHLPYPFPLPDRDMYIDSVDQNTVLDPELVKDLHRQPPVFKGSEGSNRIVWDSFQFTDENVPVTGWGDEEDQLVPGYTIHQSISIHPTGWDHVEDQVPPMHKTHRLTQIEPTGWGNDEDHMTNIYAADGCIQIEPTGWGELENMTDDRNNKDLTPLNYYENDEYCGDIRCGRDHPLHRGSDDSYSAWKWQKFVS